MATSQDLTKFDFVYRPGEDLPYSMLRRLIEAGPVIWNEDVKGWLITAYDAVRTVFTDMEHFTSEGTPIAETFAPEAMLVNDTPLHNEMRAVWSKAVSRARIEQQGRELDERAGQLLDALLPALETGETVDLVHVFRDMVMAFIAESFAIPEAQLDIFVRWSQLAADAPAMRLEADSEDQRRHQEAKQAGYDLIHRQIADRRERFAAGEQPGDLISLMVAAENREGFTPTNVADNLFNLVLGAMDTTEKWMGSSAWRLIAEPGLAAEVKSDRSLVEPFIQEVMRYDTVAQIIQRRVRDGGATLAGKQMRGGDTVYTMLGAANRDPGVFRDPETFDIHRPLKANLAFGFGFHHCLGIHVARQQTAAFVNALLDRAWSLKVEECNLGDTWALWGPRALRISLAHER